MNVFFISGNVDGPYTPQSAKLVSYNGTTCTIIVEGTKFQAEPIRVRVPDGNGGYRPLVKKELIKFRGECG